MRLIGCDRGEGVARRRPIDIEEIRKGTRAGYFGICTNGVVAGTMAGQGRAGQGVVVPKDVLRLVRTAHLSCCATLSIISFSSLVQTKPGRLAIASVSVYRHGLPM